MSEPGAGTRLDHEEAERIYRQASASAARRRRFRRTRTLAASTLAVGVMAVGIGWAAWELRPARDEVAGVSPDASPAPSTAGTEEPGAGYRFLDVEVALNHEDYRTATVSYRFAWAGDVYPGELQCTVTVFDATGKQVGRAPLSVSALTPPPGRLFSIDVDVSGEPKRAEIVCDPDRLDVPVAYVISDVRIERRSDDVIEVYYHVGWPDEVRPPHSVATNVCRETLRGPGGWEISQEFTIMALAPPTTLGPHRYDDPRALDADISELTVTVDCHPFTEADLDAQ